MEEPFEKLSAIKQMARQRETREDEEKAAAKRLRAPKMTVCESCGTVNDSGARRCVSCGQKLGMKKPADPQKRLKRFFALCYIAGILIPPAGIIIALISVFSAFFILFAVFIYSTLKA